MAYPTEYERIYDFSDFQEDNPSDPLPANQVDAEFDAVKVALDSTQTFAENVINAEGELVAGIVTPTALSSATIALIGSGAFSVESADWTTATAYAVGDLVRYNASVATDGTYVCAVAHTSGTFATDLAAGKWTLIALEAAVTYPISIANGGTGATSASDARTALSAAKSGANSDISSLTGLSTPLSVAQGGTGAITGPLAKVSLGIVDFSIEDMADMASQIADADQIPLYDTSADGQYSVGALALLSRNLLINGGMDVWQLGTGSTSRADDVYALDGWYVLTQTGAINAVRSDLPFDGARQALRLTQAQASAQRIGLGQIVEGRDSIPTRGRSVVLSGRAQCSTTATLRYAILSWSGTEDSVTSDVVADWTSAVFTTSGFFNSTTLAVVATGSVALTAGTWADITMATGAVPSACTNLIVVFHTDATLAQNVTLDFANIKLAEGSVATPYVHEPFATAVQRAQRLFEKTFALETAPAEGVGLAGGHDLTAQGIDGVFDPITNWVFKVEKRATPTVALFNPRAAGTDAQWDSNSASLGAARALGPTTSHVQIDNTGTPPSGVSARYYICATADCRL